MNQDGTNQITGQKMHEKMQENINYKILYLAAFLLPVVIAGIICIKNEVYPFGENCILHIDMYHQYEPFFTELMDKLKHGGSLLYSWRIGLGSDFIALIAYYLASPLNIFLIFCPASHVIEFMTVLVILKIGFCGLTFAVYLNRHFRQADMTAVIFSSFYALSGYMAAYSWNVMWLDCLALAPLVILGLERMVKNNRCGLYCLGLGLAILTNFYIAYMICLFLIIYFAILLFEEVHGIRARAACMGRFAGYSLLAGGMGAVLMIPEAVILSYSGSSDLQFTDALQWYFDPLSMLVRHCVDVDVYTGREHWPNLYCGVAVFLFLVLYFLNRQISFKKKVSRGIFILLFWLGFSNNLLDFIWHGMHFPDSLPGRQSFLYIFLLLVLAYETYLNREGNRILDVGIAVLLSGGFLAAAAVVADSGLVAADALILTAMLLCGYGLVFALWHIREWQMQRMAVWMACILAVLELYVNFSITGLSVTSRTAYTRNWESVQELLSQVRRMDPDPFYRVEEMERLTKNDAAVYGYSSSTIFSSMMNIGVSSLYRKVGMEGGKNFYSYSGATPLLSAMLSVKYLISSGPYEAGPLCTMVAEDGENYIYRNLYTLPPGFMLPEDFEEKWDPQSGRAVSNLNRMAELLGASEDLLVPYGGETKAGDESTTVSPLEDGYLYAVYADTSVTNLTVTNGIRMRKFSKCDHGYLLDLGWCRGGDEVKITNSSGVSEFKVQVYRLNLDALAQAYHTLSRQTFVVDAFTDTRIRGHITAEEKGNLVMSIPQESGWHILVDGKETESYTFMDSMIKIPLEAGEHNIELFYLTPGLIPGACVSAASFVAFVLLQIRRKRKSV